MLIKEKVYWPFKFLQQNKFVYVLDSLEKKKFIFPKKKILYLKAQKLYKKYHLIQFKVKILQGFELDLEKKKYNILLQKIYFNIKQRLNYSIFINFFCIRFREFKWSLQFYIKYLYYFFRHIFIFHLINEKQKLFNFKFLYDVIYILYFRNYTYRYLQYYWSYLTRFIDYKKHFEISNISVFLNKYLPIFDLNKQVTLCFIFRLRNLFLFLKYFDALQLFETTGLDYHHNGRKRKSCQIKCLSNILWHLIVRDRIKDIVIFFFNLKHNSFDFLTYITHIQYLKRFKGYTLNITYLNIRFREQYGFIRGRKLAIRKRFLQRKRKIEKFSFFKEKKKYLP